MGNVSLCYSRIKSHVVLNKCARPPGTLAPKPTMTETALFDMSRQEENAKKFGGALDRLHKASGEEGEEESLLELADHEDSRFDVSTTNLLLPVRLFVLTDEEADWEQQICFDFVSLNHIEASTSHHEHLVRRIFTPLPLSLNRMRPRAEPIPSAKNRSARGLGAASQNHQSR